MAEADLRTGTVLLSPLDSFLDSDRTAAAPVGLGGVTPIAVYVYLTTCANSTSARRHHNIQKTDTHSSPRKTTTSGWPPKCTGSPWAPLNEALE